MKPGPRKKNKQGKYSTLEQRIKWLMQHESLLIGELSDRRVREIVLAMKVDGLISRISYWPDCRSGIKAAFEQAKKRKR